MAIDHAVVAAGLTQAVPDNRYLGLETVAVNRYVRRNTAAVPPR
jgi:hypothetical protein